VAGQQKFHNKNGQIKLAKFQVKMLVKVMKVGDLKWWSLINNCWKFNVIYYEQFMVFDIS